MAPVEDVWNGALDLLREREFKIEQQDNTAQTLRATREIFVKMLSDRATPATAHKIRHQVDLSIKADREDRSILEVIYRIDKVVEEDEAFRFLQALRDRVAIGRARATPTPARP
jgi:flagellar biosynthesis regulator FlbT